MVLKNLSACLSVCLSVAKFDLNYQERAEICFLIKIFTSCLQLKNNNPIQKKFAGLGARAVLVGPILPVFAQKQPFLDKQLPRPPPFAGGMKFAT